MAKGVLHLKQDYPIYILGITLEIMILRGKDADNSNPIWQMMADVKGEILDYKSTGWGSFLTAKNANGRGKITALNGKLSQASDKGTSMQSDKIRRFFNSVLYTAQLWLSQAQVKHGFNCSQLGNLHATCNREKRCWGYYSSWRYLEW